MNTQLQEEPLHALFERAWSSYEDTNEQQAEDAIRWLQAAIAKVSVVGIFSSNEEADDIATADLKYLLLPYMQGYLLSETHESDTQKRLASLKEADHHLVRFLEEVRHYKVLSQEQEAALGAAVQPGGQLDAATKRAHKIRRFQVEKAVRAELDGMKMKNLRSKRLRQIQQEDGDTDEPQGNNEDAEREIWLKQIALASLKAADRLSSIQQEAEVLKHAASLPQAERSRPALDQAPPPDLMASLQRAHATLSMHPAERMRGEVFRPTHILPTRTLAEQADMEMAAAQRASEAQSRAEAARAAAKAADKGGEQETLRQRAWDDWKDDNPRGAGNSKLRPTA